MFVLVTGEAFNFSRKSKVPTNLKQWIEASDMQSENTCMEICKINEVDSEQLDWATVLNELSRKQTFADLRNYVQSHPLSPLVCELHTHMTEAAKAILDFVALHYLPHYVPDSYTPYQIVGDGNCYPRSVSFLVFGTQDRHIEIHVHLVYEAVQNKDIYLDNNYLHRGANHEYCRATLPEQFAQYSDNWNPAASHLNVRDIYEQEVLDICKLNTFMGIGKYFRLVTW